MSSTHATVSSTPILCSGVLPKAPRKNRVPGIIVGLLIGLAFAALLNKVGQAEPGFNILYYFGSLALVIAVHELGHLMAGWVVGFHFSLLSLGPLTIAYEYGRLKVRIRNNFGTLGYARMHVETIFRLRRRLLIYVGAGPAANIISGIVAAVFVASASPAFRNSWKLSFCSGFAMLSFLIGLMSLRPYGKTLRSDGARIQMLLRSPIQTRRWISSAALLSQQQKGIRPRAWKRSWLKAVCAVRDKTADELSGNILAYIAASDRKDDRTAADHLERCLELAPHSLATTRDFIVREASYFCAWSWKDLDLTDKWLSQAQSSNHATPLLQFRYKTAIASARGDFDGAMANWQKGLDLIVHLPNNPMNRQLLDSWQEWATEIRLRNSEASQSDNENLAATARN